MAPRIARLTLGLGLAATACAPSAIRPPAEPRDPVVVYVADHGRHASLLLPDAEGWVEYDYGDWRYYAQGRDGPLDGALALFIPTDGALGRRLLDEHPRVDLERGRLDALHAIAVERTLAAALAERLDARFDRATDPPMLNAEIGVAFVRDGTRYSLGHHCNHELVAWLEALGCSVDGAPLIARYRLVPPTPEEGSASPDR